MGNESSHYAFELLDSNEKLYLPIPASVYNPIRLWTINPTENKKKKNKKRKRDDAAAADEPPAVNDVNAFVKFINTPAQVNAVYEQGAGETSDSYVDAMFDHFNGMDAFKTFWAGLCGTTTRYSQRCCMVDVEDGKVVVGEASRNYRILHDTKFVQSCIYTAVTAGMKCFIPMSITLNEEDGMHANMGVLKYDPERRVVSCLVFEPHAVKEESDPTVKAMRRFIRDTLAYTVTEVPGGELPRVKVRSPWTTQGLQGNAPVCVQWSALMFFTYMLNCEVGGTCDTKASIRVLQHMWEIRKSIIPIWMFYMNQIIVKSSSLETQFLDPEFEPDSEIDPYRCSDAWPCRYPCALGSNGKCYNKKMFNN